MSTAPSFDIETASAKSPDAALPVKQPGQPIGCVAWFARAFGPHRDPNRKVNGVPQVTIWFWIIKCLATAMGETVADLVAADALKSDRPAALPVGIFAAILAGTLGLQFFLRRYVALVYWLCVILISILGTLVTDALSDNASVGHNTTVPVFAVLMVVSLVVWYWSEKTLSVHEIYTLYTQRSESSFTVLEHRAVDLCSWYCRGRCSL